jgi:hypothetical protein
VREAGNGQPLRQKAPVLLTILQGPRVPAAPAGSEPVTTPPGTVDLIRKLWQQGNSTRQLAAKARISQSTASRHVRRFEELKQAAGPPGREAPPAVGGPVVMLTCIRCWRRYLASAQRVADLFCPQCTR